LKPGDFMKFRELVKRYSDSLSASPHNYTNEISLVSKDLFERRTIQSYDTFLKLIS
jgi:hypothetical protein